MCALRDQRSSGCARRPAGPQPEATHQPALVATASTLHAVSKFRAAKRHKAAHDCTQDVRKDALNNGTNCIYRRKGKSVGSAFPRLRRKLSKRLLFCIQFSGRSMVFQKNFRSDMCFVTMLFCEIMRLRGRASPRRVASDRRRRAVAAWQSRHRPPPTRSARSARPYSSC